MVMQIKHLVLLCYWCHFVFVVRERLSTSDQNGGYHDMSRHVMSDINDKQAIAHA